jgi:hypothetical protein
VHLCRIIEATSEEGDDTTFLTNGNDDAAAEGFVAARAQHPEGLQTLAQLPTDLRFAARDQESQ